MKSVVLEAAGAKTWALIFDKGDEPVAGLTAFTKSQTLGGAHFTAIGAFSEVVLGYFDRAARDYKKIPLREQFEVLSLVGDVALDCGEPKVHAHVVVGRADGEARGGHLLVARVWPTLELVLTESPRHLRKRYDPDTGPRPGYRTGADRPGRVDQPRRRRDSGSCTGRPGTETKFRSCVQISVAPCSSAMMAICRSKMCDALIFSCVAAASRRSAKPGPGSHS